MNIVLPQPAATSFEEFMLSIVANKQLIYHANGGGRKLEEGLASLRRLRTDPEFLLQRLMFTKSLQTPPLLDNAR